MFILKIVFAAVMLLAPLFANDAFSQRRNQPTVRVLLVTGGHSFDREEFDNLMNLLSGVSVTEVKHPEALAMFRPENRTSFDVALFYDMPNVISEQEKSDFIDMLNEGKGIVVLHHAFCSYQNWAEYQNIIGGRYHQQPWTDSDGVQRPASSYKYNVRMRVRVADRRHPVTRGIRDFDITDETYANGSVNPDVHVLLTTDEPSSTPSVAWAHKYGNSRVVTILLGHDNVSWTNPNFVKLLSQGLLWVK